MGKRQEITQNFPSQIPSVPSPALPSLCPHHPIAIPSTWCQQHRQLQPALFSLNRDQWLPEFKRFINFLCSEPGDKNPLSRAASDEDNKTKWWNNTPYCEQSRMVLPSDEAPNNGEFPSFPTEMSRELQPSDWNAPFALMHKWANSLDPSQNHRCVYPKTQVLAHLAAWAALACTKHPWQSTNWSPKFRASVHGKRNGLQAAAMSQPHCLLPQHKASRSTASRCWKGRVLTACSFSSALTKAAIFAKVPV